MHLLFFLQPQSWIGLVHFDHWMRKFIQAGLKSTCSFGKSSSLQVMLCKTKNNLLWVTLLDTWVIEMPAWALHHLHSIHQLVAPLDSSFLYSYHHAKDYPYHSQGHHSCHKHEYDILWHGVFQWSQMQTAKRVGK